MHQFKHLVAAGMVALLLVVALTPAALPAQQVASDTFVAAQSAAMLPADAGDLDQAAAWDRYRIVAALDPATLTLRGTVNVAITNRSPAAYQRLYFRLYPNHPDFGGRLDVTGARVDGQHVASGTEQRDTLIWLALPQPLPPGGQTTAELSFATRTPRNASSRTFGAHNFEAGLWSLANFYPVLARQLAGGGWDRRPIEPRGDFTVTDTALYEATVDVPAGWELIATGVRTSAEPVANGVRRERFVSGPQREFYLGASQGLDQASTMVDGTRVVSHYQRDDAAAGRRALLVGEQSLKAFNARFGPYPFAELEIVQGAMTQFLGMEYPGVVLIEQQLYERNGSGLETTVAHEVAHQWWYSLVGSDAQGEPWLDEGLASYSQVLYYETIGATAQARAELTSLRNMYLQARRAGRDAPLGSPPSALRNNYVPIVYGKGGLFFAALRARIGDEAFGRFLKGYEDAERYGEATGPDLLRAAERACGCELDGFYRDWVQTTTAVAVP